MWFCRWIRSTNKQLVTHGVKTPSASLSYCVCASDGGRRKIISVSSGWSAWNKGQIKLMWVFFFCLCSYWKEKGAADTKLFLIFTWMLTSGQYAQDWLFTGSVQPVSRLEGHRPHPPVSLLISNRSGVVLIDNCFPSWKNKWAECWDYKWGDVIALSFARAAHLATSVNDISAAIRVVAVDLLK